VPIRDQPSREGAPAATERSGPASMLQRSMMRRPIRRSHIVNMTLSLAPIVSLLAGILILVAPRMLNYIVAIYLILIGLLGLFGGGNIHLR
jgi:hypothetical protein